MTNELGPITERTAQDAMSRLNQLFPALTELTSMPSDSAPSMWTPQELGWARRESAKRLLQSGWKLLDDGLFHKGNVSRRPSEMVPLRMPGDFGFDWTRDAFAIRLGAKYVSPNRYQYGEHFMDHLGRFIDTKLCRYCGGHPYFVQVVDPWPGAQRYERGRTYCRHCVTPTMLAENERNVQGWVPPRPVRR